MQSKDILMPVITDLGLDKIWAKRVYKSTFDKLPEQDAMAYMNRIFHPDYKRGTDIIMLTVTGDLPQECADIANHIADRYKAARDAEVDQKSTKGTTALQDQITQQTAEVKAKRDAVEAMRQDLGKNGVNMDTSGFGNAPEGSNGAENELAAGPGGL